MKTICTQIAFFFLLVIAQSTSAQTSLTGTCTVSSSVITPTMYGYGTADSIKAPNGYTSTNTANGGFNVYPKGVAAQSTKITSPALQYPTAQSSLFFKYNFDIANNPGASSSCTGTMVITFGSTTVTAPVSFTIINGGGDYYFQFDFPSGQQLPANVPFSVSLTLNIPNNQKAVTAYTLTSNAPVTSHIILPVSFTQFTARSTNGSTSLSWNVATEAGVTGYEIQRSIDGSGFSAIGFVGAGSASSYSFIDSKGGDLVYYRIKAIDIDGKYSYSIIVNIKGLQSDVVLKAFPTPVQSSLTVQHSAVNNGSLEVVSADGRMIKALSLSLNTQQTTIDLSSAKSGVYFVRLIANDIIKTLRIIKQ